MKETELKPCPITEEIKEQADLYISEIMIELCHFQTHASFQNPTIIMSRDVLDVLEAGTERPYYVDHQFQTICGCEVELVSGIQKLYVAPNLLNRRADNEQREAD